MGREAETIGILGFGTTRLWPHKWRQDASRARPGQLVLEILVIPAPTSARSSKYLRQIRTKSLAG